MLLQEDGDWDSEGGWYFKQPWKIHCLLNLKWWLLNDINCIYRSYYKEIWVVMRH